MEPVFKLAKDANRKRHAVFLFASVGIAIASTLLFAVIVLLWVKPLNAAIDVLGQTALLLLAANIIIAILMTLLGVSLGKGQKPEIALETGKAFLISEQALSYLKEGLTKKAADSISHLLMQELGAKAVMVTDTEQILAYATKDQSQAGKIPANPLQIVAVKEVLEMSALHVYREQLESPAIVIPFKQSTQSAGLIILYFEQYEHIHDRDIVLAEGLGKLISYQLSLLETEKLRILLKDTEVRSLQAQINPHFLFNTLNTIVTLIRTNPDQARTVMVHLANFMRMNLRLMSSPIVSLEQELCLLESYVKIVQIRFAEQLTIEWDLDSNLEHFRIPPTTIQPLVENSIQHGLKRTAKGGKIRVSIRRILSGAEVIVEDNGSGIPEERLENLATKQMPSRKGSGIGVFNVNQRLVSLLGDGSRLHITNKETGGCKIAFFLPEM